MSTATARHEETATLDVRALLAAGALGHPVEQPRVVETHISWVLLTGRYAYKIHKPVRLPFLDFTTVEARRQDCLRELRLNRRWAPALYLDVVPVTGSLRAPVLGGGGPAIDYAVKMRQFPDDARLDRVLASRGLDDHLLADLSRTVAALHDAAPRAQRESPFGRPPAIRDQVLGNLDLLAAWGGLDPDAPFERAREDSLADLQRLELTFEARRASGHVRECHGDLHLENLALVDGRVLPFDGIEFQPAFRWVDVASDVAFLVMDLHARGLPGHAHGLLDDYLQRTGDYGAGAVLRHYLRYRALVRAKVAAIRADQAGDDAAHQRSEANRLVRVAVHLGAAQAAPFLVITHGVSGTGKSRLARRLVRALGAICLRADVERARLFADGAERYSTAASDATYGRLASLAGELTAHGWPVVVDATFLERTRRDAFRHLARERGVPHGILDLTAPRDVLQARVAARARRGDDASEADGAVLAGQLAAMIPLAEDERPDTLTLDTATAPDLATVTTWIQQLSAEPSP